jgi:hypothetical protein
MANPNPSPETRFTPGQSGNPGGFTAEQVEKRKANRDRAFALEEKMLSALERDMTQNEAAILQHIRADVLRLIHTAIERVDGKPQQRVDATSSDGSMSPPSVVQIVPVGPESDGEAR